MTAPNFAFWTPDDGFVVENEGVPPDVEVEQTPEDVIAGRDPQLERAIELALEGLKKNPPVRPARPPYPNEGAGRPLPRPRPPCADSWRRRPMS